MNTATGKASPNLVDYGLLTFLALVFGSSFSFTSVSLSEIPPITVAASRLLFAFLMLYPIMLYYKQSLPTNFHDWIWISASAFFGNALPFSLISWGQVKVDAGLTSIFMAIMPLATIMLAHFVTRDEKINTPKFIGVLLGLAGVVVLMGWDALTSLGDHTLRQLAIVLATVSYAVNAIITKKLTHLPRKSTIAALMLVASIQMVPFSLLVDQPWTLTPGITAIISILVLAAGPTALATLMILVIIDRQSASFLSQINFMVPVFGVILAILFLHERLPPNGYIALALIILGIAISRRGNMASGQSPAGTAEP